MAFKILPGLPPYGPLPVQFSPFDWGRYREGFVVEFQSGNGAWVGNFTPVATGFDTALEHLDGRSVIVIAGGQGYVVDPWARKVTSMFGGDITGILHADADRLVFSTFTEFEAYGAKGLQWRTRQLSWDGFRSLRVDGGVLKGEAWTPVGEQWIEFTVELATGAASGGSYQ